MDPLATMLYGIQNKAMFAISDNLCKTIFFFLSTPQESLIPFVSLSAHLRNIGQKLIQVAAPFDASQSDKCSTKCKLHTQQFLRSLEKMELWAFQSKFRIYTHFVNEQLPRHSKWNSSAKNIFLFFVYLHDMLWTPNGVFIKFSLLMMEFQTIFNQC